MKNNLLYYLFWVVRIFIYPFALIYGTIVWLRNRLYDIGFFGSVEFSVPVISIGNLSTGGTGKTPHVEYFVRLLQYQYKIATMSRGYKRYTQGFLIADENTNAVKIGDEPMQYYIKFPELTVCVVEDRMTGIPTLLQKRNYLEVILLDDAYQHRSVKSGINLLITDYNFPYYSDYILPFGSLRESRTASKRANIIIVSKCPLNLNNNAAQQIIDKLKPFENQKVYFTSLKYSKPYDFFSKESFNLNNKNIIIVCGIAKPEPLIEYIKSITPSVHKLLYKDHHYFVSQDIEEIKETFYNWKVEDKIIVTTEKDAARLLIHIDKLKTLNIPIVVIPIEIEVLFDKGTELNYEIINYVAATIAESNLGMMTT